MKPNTPLATVLLTAVACSGASAAWFDNLAGIDLGGGPNIPVLPIATRYSGQETHVYLMDLQGAIDDAQPGDRIEVGPGIWPGGLIVEDKSDLLIFGSMGAVSTIIDGQTLSRGLELIGSNHITINGLQFRNCFSGNGITDCGGGVDIRNCHSMHMTECWFKNNSSVQHGGGLHAFTVDGLSVRDSWFMDNQAGFGGGVSLVYCEATLLEGCWIADNEAILNGGGLYVAGEHDAEVTVSECGFASNKARYSGSAVASWSHDHGRSSLLLSQCVMMNNAAGPVWIEGSATVWCDQNMDVQSLACTYWKNTGNNAGCAAVYDSASLRVSGARMYGNRSRTPGTDMIDFGESANASIANSRVDCGRQFSDIVTGEYEEFGQNEIIDHCVYTADMNFDATIDIHDLLILFEQWGPYPEVADLVRSSPGQSPRIDATDLILILETWGESMDHPLL
jgi:hypothetical protein